MRPAARAATNTKGKNPMNSDNVNTDLVLEASNLCKVFGSVRALDNANLSVRRGEFIGLAGPNGAGKTTLIHILLGLVTPSSGIARMFGLCPMRQRHLIAPRLNFASAYATLPTNLTLLENMRIFAGIYNIARPDEKIASLLELFGIAHLRKRVTGALSSGEKTRLNLCKALLNDPELLLLDEPTASLDPEMADTVRRTLTSIHTEKNMGVLYTSHNMQEVERMCSQVHFISHGRIIEHGAPAEVIARMGCSSMEEVFIKVVRKERERS